METVTVTEAKATLSRLVQRVLDGETIAIGRRGVPEVVLTAVAHDPTPRALGQIQVDDDGERIWVGANFDDPLPEFEQSAAKPLW